jgi:hypothetical protein
MKARRGRRRAARRAGNLHGPTRTDDPYYRLFLANIGGRWHVLGTDVFAHGCGC